MVALLFLGIAASSPSDACLSCHSDSSIGAHPYNVTYQAVDTLKPVSMVPADLLVDGRVECTSCHFTHDDQTDNAFRLRRATTTELCAGCHDMRGR